MTNQRSMEQNDRPMNIKDFEKKCFSLLAKRGMYPSKKVGLTAFSKHFIAHAWWAHSLLGDGDKMLDILSDDAKLVCGDCFNKNFYSKLDQIYPKELKTNNAWQRLMPTLIEFKGKGLGVGEMYLALVISGWTVEREDGKGDGKVAGGLREIKKNEASLKPLEKAIRVQDQLNETLFEGNRAGPVTKFEKHRAWIEKKGNAEEIYRNYFSQLYPGRDVEIMSKELANTTDGQKFNDIIGKKVLSWYKDVDKWSSLIIINEKKMMIGNIADVNNLSMFKDLKFSWKSERGKDTQAITDGYVNISI